MKAHGLLRTVTGAIVAGDDDDGVDGAGPPPPPPGPARDTGLDEDDKPPSYGITGACMAAEGSEAPGVCSC